MPPKRKAAQVATRRVQTRSQSRDPNPHPPPSRRRQPQRQPEQEPEEAARSSPHPSPSLERDYPPAPRRHARPTRARGQVVMTMGSIPPGPSSSASGPAPPGNQTLNSNVMVNVKDTLLQQSKQLINHLNEQKRDESWPLLAKVFNQFFEQARDQYLLGDTIFIDPAIREKIAEEKTEAIADPVLQAAYTANLTTLLYLCNQFKSSAEANILTELLQPLDDTFPSHFVPIVQMDKERASELADLAVWVRCYRALAVVDGGIKEGDNLNTLREQVTDIFFGAKDEDIESFAEGGDLRRFVGLSPERENIAHTVRSLDSMLQNEGDYDAWRQEISNEKLPLLEKLEEWARKTLELGPARDSQPTLRRQSDAAATIATSHPDDEPGDYSESSDSGDDDDVAISRGIAEVARRDGPPGSSPTQRDGTPQDYPEVTLDHIRASQATAPQRSQRLPNIQEDSDSLLVKNGTPVQEGAAVGWRRRPVLSTRDMGGMENEEAEDEEEQGAFQTDARGPKPKRRRVVADTHDGSVASVAARRPLPGTPGYPTSPRRRKPRSGSNSAAPRSRAVSGATNGDDAEIDFSVLRSQNTEARASKKAKVQHRIPWMTGDEKTLIRAVGTYMARWSVIAKETEFDVGRDQQQVRDKARNLKVDFLLADAALPHGFDLVALGSKERQKVISMGKNPDRKVDDWDEEEQTVTNNIYMGDN
ncbi:hypothetical protein MKZ38_004665 [Zalerion maritima]|uniref:Myb-like domain-containing protein n=1 Tax=Zalerion maritima TaxID=339359 RepID=A0AAD5RLM8_9PEZI|nr:hypothetical protein MKZ38_004665 [Zalerion maritima]